MAIFKLNSPRIKEEEMQEYLKNGNKLQIGKVTCFINQFHDVVVVFYFILSRLLYLAYSANLGLLCMPHPGMGPLI